MQFDFDVTYFPTTIDMLHAGLAGVAIVELFLLVFLLTVVVIGLVRKSTGAPSAKAEQAPPVVEKQPVPKAKAAGPASVAKREKAAATKQPAPAVMKSSAPDSALQLLGLLQQEARFIDFVEEEIASYSDADIGAAARIVHEGCRKVLSAHFTLEPVRTEPENQRITLQPGFDPSAIRLTGKIVGQPPFSGTLVHRGWRASSVQLPKLAEQHNVNIIAPAEVEL